MIAEITYWYGVDAGALDKQRLYGLKANLGRVQAQDKIHRNDFDALDYEGVYELYRSAYGDGELANRARTQSMKAYVHHETEAARQT